MGCVAVSVQGASGLFTLASSVFRYRLYFELRLAYPGPFVVGLASAFLEHRPPGGPSFASEFAVLRKARSSRCL
jgi:hypothetical protein